MKIFFAVIGLLLFFSCNNSSEDIDTVADTSSAILVGQVPPPEPVLSTEEKLSTNLQYFTKEKIDSMDVEDILEVVKDILDALHQASETDEWEKAKEYYDKTESAMKESERGTAIFNENRSDFSTIKTKIEGHRLEELEADKHLQQITAESRWEKLRKTFRRKLYDGELTEFSNEQQNEFKQILSQWDDYKQNNKLSWYRNRADNLEDLFFNYSRSNGKVKAAWGFMIQQVDWDGAVNYYTNIAPDSKAMGKPYYMLKYYYHTINKGAQFEDLYDNATDDCVDELCPPVH